jgi:hypothetical protein
MCGPIDARLREALAVALEQKMLRAFEAAWDVADHAPNEAGLKLEAECVVGQYSRREDRPTGVAAVR